MAEAGAKNLYDVRVGERVYQGLTTGVVLRNIQNGKLKGDDEIAAAGSGKWVRLKEVPELKKFFAPPQPAGLETIKITLYEVRKAYGDPLVGLSRARIIDMIRKNEIAEVDEIRMAGSDEWAMAGDVAEFSRFFEMRRSQSATFGGGASYRDTGKPFYADLVAPFRYLANGTFLINLLAVMIAYAIAALAQIPIIAGPITILTNFYIYSYYFRVISNTANGGTSFPEAADFSDFTAELVRPSIQFFFTTVVASLPLLLYIGLVLLKGFDFFVTMPYYQAVLTSPWISLILPYPTGGEDILNQMITSMPAMEGSGEVFGGVDPSALDATLLVPTGFAFHFWDIFIWLGLIFFLFYLPISLMRQAAYGSFWPAFNVPAVGISIGRAFGPYLALVAFMLVVDALGILLILGFALIFGTSMVMGVFTSGFDPTNPIAGLVTQTIFVVVVQAIVISATFMKMYFIGRYLFQNEKRMGWD